MSGDENTAGRLETRYVEAIAQLGQRALIVNDVAGLLREGVELVAELLSVDFVHVLEHDDAAHEFVLRVVHGFEGELGARYPDDVGRQSGWALHNRTAAVVNDVKSETRFEVSPFLQDLGVASAVTVVIRGPGRPYGVLGLSVCEPRQFTPEEVDFAQSMANVLGTAAARGRIDAALRAERERLRLALDAGGMGDWGWDTATNRVTWSESMHEIFGMEPGTFNGDFDDYLALVHPEDREQLTQAVADALAGGDDNFYTEHRTTLPDGSVRWISGRGLVLRGDDGRPTGMIGVGSDITDRVEAEYRQGLLYAAEQEARAEAEAARDRLEFLAQASEALASKLDYHETLKQVANLTVSRLADWCAVDILEDDGRAPSTVAVAHVNPEKVAMAKEFRAKYPPDPESHRGIMAVIESGQPMLVPVVTDDMLVEAAIDEDHLAAVRDLGITSSMVVPLTARARTLGAITILSAESGRIYTDDDLALAMDLARRAAVAIDNARLYAERSKVAEALQRSLLPPTRPEIPGLELAARYLPIGQGAEIGGDFFDVFEAREDSWAVVIGDVCGKGTEAADLTGLARDTIRGLSIRERSPRRVLQVLNEVILRRGEDSRFLTVALAAVEVDDGRARMRIACAGHPLPLLVRSDGSIEEAGVPGMLVGLFPEIDPVDAHVELAGGDSLVLYTDGVIEAHGPDGLYGEGRLRSLLSTLTDADADTMAQAVIDDVDAYRPGPPQDDVAVVVVRVP